MSYTNVKGKKEKVLLQYVPNKHQGLARSSPEGTSKRRGHFVGQHGDGKQESHPLIYPLVEKFHLFSEAHNLEQHHPDDNR